ncbi:hypothetical protein N7540_012688 [Penicillium herquei]|nr:hypothetical protein N7540_012688 [Penicillium herquei]
MPLTSQMMRNFSHLCAMIPPRAVVRELIEIYFSEANWYLAILEKHYFEKLFSSWCALSDQSRENFEGIPRDLLHIPALIFQVLAVALQFTAPNMPCIQALGIESFTQRDCLSNKFSARGMEILSLVGRHDPTITAVQSDLMRSLWLKNSSRGREAWQVLGGAIRMAQDLGLHRQAKVIQKAQSPLEETLDLLWYDEYKRRLWVKLYSWDSHMAFTLDRPRAINSSDCTIMTPLDRDIPADPAKTIPTALFSHEPPSSFTPHLFQYAVCQQIHEAMSLGLHRSHIDDYGRVQAIHDRILSLLNNLPPVHRLANPDTSWDSTHTHIPKQRQQIATAAHSFLVALHRPHSKTHAASREAAIQSALSILDAQERLFALMANQYSNIYALSIYTVDASIFLSAATLQYPPSDPALTERIDLAIEKAKYRLEFTKERVSLSNSALQILKLCHLKKQSLPHLQFYAPTFAVPQSTQIGETAASGARRIDGTSDRVPRSPVQANMPSAMSNFEPSQIDSAVMFDDFIMSDFDVESWVQQMGLTNGLDDY